MKRVTWLLAACAVAGFGCSSGDGTQVITGRVTSQGAIAVRAIAGASIVTAGRVRSDGSFTLVLPAGARYRLEVLTASGVRNVVGTKDAALADLVFRVCEPTDPFDLGGLGTPGLPPMCDPMDPSCEPPTCDSTDPNCVPPQPCDPLSDPSCDPCNGGMTYPDGTCGEPPKCDPTDPNCLPPEPPPPCQPGDANCMGCDPTTDPYCVPPPPCDPADSTCGSCDGVILADGTCGMCDPTIEANCPIPPPPCMDPMDPNTCKDPCVEDPALCGCASDGTLNEMTCWPPPEPCDFVNGTCMPGDGLTPEHPPGDFGCQEPNG